MWLRRMAALALAASMLTGVAAGLGLALAEDDEPGSPDHFGFQPSSDEYVGSLVAFRFSAASGTILEYRSIGEDEVLLEKVYLGGPVGQPREEGSIFFAQGSAVAVMIHDSPTLLLQVAALQTVTARITLGSLQAGESDFFPRGMGLHLESDETEAALFVTNGTLALQGREVEAALRLGSMLTFRVRPTLDDITPGLGASLLSQIARNRLGAEVALDLRQGRADVDIVAYRPTLEVRPLRLATNALELEVEDADARGTILVLRLSPGLMRLNRQEALRVALDGRNMAAAPTPDGVLHGEGSGDEAATYYPVLNRGHVLLLLVYLPHFSARVLSVGAVLPGTVVLDLPSLVMLLSGIGVVATAALVIFRRR